MALRRRSSPRQASSSRRSIGRAWLIRLRRSSGTYPRDTGMRGSGLRPRCAQHWTGRLDRSLPKAAESCRALGNGREHGGTRNRRTGGRAGGNGGIDRRPGHAEREHRIRMPGVPCALQPFSRPCGANPPSPGSEASHLPKLSDKDMGDPGSAGQRLSNSQDNAAPGHRWRITASSGCGPGIRRAPQPHRRHTGENRSGQGDGQRGRQVMCRQLQRVKPA